MNPAFSNGVYYPPGRKVLWYFVSSKLLMIIFLFILLCVGTTFLPGFGVLLPLIIMLGVLLCVLVTVLAYLRYISVRFMFDEFSFHVSKGIFSKSEIAIPYKQIQNVNHDQSINEKMWGIAHITIETAGTDESGSSARSEGVLPVLDAALALALERELMQRASGK